jgi:hypothetical protein
MQFLVQQRERPAAQRQLCPKQRCGRIHSHAPPATRRSRQLLVVSAESASILLLELSPQRFVSGRSIERARKGGRVTCASLPARGRLQAVLRRGDEEHGTCPAHPVGDNANAQDGAIISPSGEVCLALEGAAEERRDSRREWGSAVWTSRWSRSSRMIWKPVAEELARLAHGQSAAPRLHVRCGR